MANKQALKRRIKSTKSISKITRAMEAVSGSKMIKAQTRASNGQDYSDKLALMIAQVNMSAIGDRKHPLLTAPNPDSSSLTIIISSDKGLAGAFNTNLFRKLEKVLDEKAKIITIGKKIFLYSKKTAWENVASFETMPDFPDFSETKPASDIALEEYLNGNISSVSVAYQKFINTIKSEPTIEQILPISSIDSEIQEKSKLKKNIIFEPSAEELLKELLSYSISVMLYQAVLSSKAAEQSARMVAMKNASQNAQDLGSSLTRKFNKEYQKSVTEEISDVVTARMALR